MRFGAIVSLFVLFASVLFVATPATQAQGSPAQVRVVHASPDAPAVDVYVDGSAVLTNVPFFTASDYLELPAGDYLVQVAPAGTSAADAVLEGTFTLEAGTGYTVAATGLLANLTATVLVDDLSPTAAGEARVFVYHFSPDAPAVDVKLADGTVLSSGLAFEQGTELDVPAGTYDIVVTPAGGTDVVIDLSGTTLNEGIIYSVFATNTLASLTPELVTTNVGTAAAPAPAPTAAPDPAHTPATLPVTGANDTVPLALVLVGGVLLFGLGALVLGLRRRQS